jgi:hypothetical protein
MARTSRIRTKAATRRMGKTMTMDKKMASTRKEQMKMRRKEV